MKNKLVYTLFAIASIGVAGSFEGCTCNGDAKIGNAIPQAPTPPAPPAPPPPPAPAPVAAPAPTPAPAPGRKIIAVGKAKVEGNKVKIPGELEFDLDKATIKKTPQSQEILTTLVDFMKQNPGVTKLRVEGHTDNSGTAEHNMKLSQERADAVAQYLGENGIDKSRLVTTGYGQTKPIVENDNAEHKALNRRTEFHIAELDGKPQEEAAVTPPPPVPATPAVPTKAAPKPTSPLMPLKKK